jgi:hypothetical protein
VIALVALLIIVMSINLANDWPRLRAETQRQQREAPPPLASPIDEFDRRFTKCMEDSRGRGPCFDYKEWQEAIRRSPRMAGSDPSLTSPIA